VRGSLKQTPQETPVDAWHEYEPNKPRLLLTPTIESQVALAAFFDGVHEQNLSELRRRYRPCVPLNTFSQPEAYFPEGSDNPYRLMIHASEDFRQMNGRDEITLTDPRIKVMKYDNKRMLVVRFQGQDFEDTRAELTDNAIASIRLQHDGVERVPVARKHYPDIVMPIARTYRDEQIQRASRKLVNLFEDLFPKEIEVSPRLVPPTIAAVQASYPEKCPSGIKKRLRAYKLRKKQECKQPELPEELFDDESPDQEFAFLDPEESEYITLYQRAINVAREYPNSLVEYIGPELEPGEANLADLENLHTSLSSGSPYLYIRHD